jgi:ligand-binding SRPBCC domain-containing protein
MCTAFRSARLTEIAVWRPPHEFVDVQAKGPYKRWRHTHRFEETSDGTRILDIVHYALPLGPVGRWAHHLVVAEDLKRIFDYRQGRIDILLNTVLPVKSAR